MGVRLGQKGAQRGQKGALMGSAPDNKVQKQASGDESVTIFTALNIHAVVSSVTVWFRK